MTSSLLKDFSFYNAQNESFPPYSKDIIPPSLQNASVTETYKDRTVFLTGSTGFVGKVILEKMLRSLPDMKRVYVLVRPRKNQPAQDRLRQEVFTSPIFDTLRRSIPNFDAYVDEKVVAVGGELTQDEIGLSNQDYETLCNEVNIIIHCAAVVDFNERLDRAIELNTLGSLRVLDLGKKCKALGSFVHVSTCYVNSNQENGHIEERLYPLPFDPEEMIERVSNMPSSDLETIASTGILHTWPNTYTMTKSMTEHLLVKYHGDIPLVIVRPSIVGSAYTEPVPGWVDVISAAGAVYVAIGLGVLRFLEGSTKNVGDIIPVDYVANTIFVASSIIFNKKKQHFICHSASSSENPMCWGYPMNHVVSYFAEHKPERALQPAKFSFETPQLYQIKFFLEYSIPSAILNTIALTGNNQYKQKAQLFQKLLWQVRVLSEAFKYFTINQWCFDNRNVRSCYNMLTQSEQDLFPLRLASLDWFQYSELFSYGLCKYTLKMPILPVLARDARYINVLHKLYKPEHDKLFYRIFPDATRIQEIYASRYLAAKPMFPLPLPPQEMKRVVLSSPEIRLAIQRETELLTSQAGKKKKSSSPAKGAPVVLSPQEQAEARAKSIINEMFDEQNSSVLAPLAVVFTKIWRQVYDNVKVGQQYLPEIQHAAATGQSTGKPIVYIPTHRSYVDFLLISYVCFMIDLPLPHIVAGEDFLGIFAVRWLFRKAGAFFMKRSFSGDELYNAILQKNIDTLLSAGQALEFFIEGTRSRSGKMLQPKMGLLGKILSSINRGIVQDVTFVPISINYEKTMESFLYANELNGESKIKESLTSLLQARSALAQNFGTTTVVFGQPFSFVSWRESFIADMQSRLLSHRVLSNCNSPFLTLPHPVTTSEETAMVIVLQHLQQQFINFQRGFNTHHDQLSFLEQSDVAASNNENIVIPTHQTTLANAVWLKHTLQQRVKPVSKTTTTTPAAALSIPETNSTSSKIYDPAHNLGHKLFLTQSLANDITFRLNQQNEIFGTHIVSTILLQYSTGITFDQLIDRVQWVIAQIRVRGGYISHLEMNSINTFVKHAVDKLGPSLIQVTKRSNIYQPCLQQQADQSYPNILVLGQYKNRLIHFFFNEALWAVVIYSLLHHDDSSTSSQQSESSLNSTTSSSNDTTVSAAATVKIDVALAKVEFLYTLLRSEFITTNMPELCVDFRAVLHTMAEHDIVQINSLDNTLAIAPSGEVAFTFLCGLLWPSVDSLYSAAMLLTSLTSQQAAASEIPTISKDQFILQAQWYANSLYHNNMLCFYESCSKDTLDNIVTIFKSVGLLQPHATLNIPQNSPQYASALMSNKNSEKLALGTYYNQNEHVLEDFVNALNMLRKLPPIVNRHNTNLQVAQRAKLSARRSLAFELPMFAKNTKTKL